MTVPGQGVGAEMADGAAVPEHPRPVPGVERAQAEYCAHWEWGGGREAKEMREEISSTGGEGRVNRESGEGQGRVRREEVTLRLVRRAWVRAAVTDDAESEMVTEDGRRKGWIAIATRALSRARCLSRRG